MISSTEDVLPRLRPVNGGTSVELDSRTILEKAVGSVNSGSAGVVSDGNIGELGEVGRTAGRSGVPGLEGIGVHVVTSGLSNRVGEVEGMSESEVVRSASETDRVLIEEGRGTNGVGTGEEEKLGESSVVRLLETVLAGESILERNVASLEGEEDDGMRETNVERRARGNILEGSNLSLLDLVDKHITGSITHLNTLVVVNNSIVSKSLDILEAGLLSGGNHASGGRAVLNNVVNGNSSVATGVNHNKLLPVTEVVGNLDVVEGESSNGESDTSVLAEEEGERKRKETTTNRGTGANRESPGVNITNHVAVTLTLGSGDSPLIVVIEPEVIKLLNLEIVELNLDMADEVVHEVANPLDGGGTTSNAGSETDRGEASAEESGEDVITLARKGEGSLGSTELSSGTNVAEVDGDHREPVGLLDAGDEPGNGIRATIKETLELTKGGNVDESDRSSNARIGHP